jgi:hypothetical protein
MAMNNQLPDEKVDGLLRALIANTVADDATVDEIADSPQLWLAVHRQVAREKELEATAWPSSEKIRRWLLISVPVAAALLLALLFFYRPAAVQNDIANTSGTLDPVTSAAEDTAVVNSISEPKIAEPNIAETKQILGRNKVLPNRTSAAKHDLANRLDQTNKLAKKPEIKTDFIALSYARNPDSGQIVRVKVPSSMMVTLGLVAHVENPTNLIDAEVVVGDDRLTRAIRFIR